jgi:protein-S-isoprenylcysteine O-methyltransferase Ste14
MNWQTQSSLLLKTAKRGVAGLTFVSVTLFGAAGRLDWPAAWFYISAFAVYLCSGAWWLVRRDPDLLDERMRTAPNVPRWDRVLVRAYWVLLPTLFVTAALDAGRFGWSKVPNAIQAIGVAGIVSAFIVIWWSTAANHFLSSNARIQTDRGHTVVRDGPYRIVRHPMYAAVIVLMFGTALTLGSWLAMMPAAVLTGLFVLRTLMEDAMLIAGLSGYREYSNHVRDRLIPHVW